MGWGGPVISHKTTMPQYMIAVTERLFIRILKSNSSECFNFTKNKFPSAISLRIYAMMYIVHFMLQSHRS